MTRPTSSTTSTRVRRRRFTPPPPAALPRKGADCEGPHARHTGLDRQGPFNGSPRRDSQQQTAAPVPAATSSTLTLSVTSSNEEHDRLLAIALSSTESEPTSSEPSNRNPTAGSCPCCHQSWLTLGLTTGDSPSDSAAALDGTEQEQRASHVEACLMAREEGDQGDAAGQRGDWPDGGQHGRAEDDGGDDKAAERKGRQVPNGVGAGMKGATTSRAGGGGDAVHETAVLSTPGASPPSLPHQELGEPHQGCRRADTPCRSGAAQT